MRVGLEKRLSAKGFRCWKRLLRVPWTARRSNQSILTEIKPEHSLEELMLKLKLQYCGHLMRRANSLEKTLMLGKTEGRRRGWQRMRWLDGITDMCLSKLWDTVKTREAWSATVHGVAKSCTQLSKWKTDNHKIKCPEKKVFSNMSLSLKVYSPIIHNFCFGW